MSNKNDYLFRAKTVEAYTIKSISEVLQNILTDVCFIFDKDCIKLLTVDNKRPARLLVHLKLNGDAYNEYHCPKPLSVGVNLQHLYKMCKSIKKKDKNVLFIKKSAPGLLGVTTIQADSGQPVTSHIKIQKLSQVETALPDDYDHPIHISTSTYQKMCKDMQGISNEIKVQSTGSFLKFRCEVEGMYDREVSFGELEDDDNKEYDYCDSFYTKSLSQLIKVSGLNNRMQVYTPTHERSPLKISINTGQLGKLEVFIKSIAQITNTDQ